MAAGLGAGECSLIWGFGGAARLEQVGRVCESLWGIECAAGVETCRTTRRRGCGQVRKPLVLAWAVAAGTRGRGHSYRNSTGAERDRRCATICLCRC